MAPLNDPERLLAYKNALSNWAFEGFVEPELSDQAYRWIRRELGRFELKELYRLMHEYVVGGGEVDEVRETRPEWRCLRVSLRFAILHPRQASLR